MRHLPRDATVRDADDRDIDHALVLQEDILQFRGGDLPGAHLDDVLLAVDDEELPVAHVRDIARADPAGGVEEFRRRGGVADVAQGRVARSHEQFAQLALFLDGGAGFIVDESEHDARHGAADALGGFAFGVGERGDPAAFGHAVDGDDIRVRVEQAAELGLHGETEWGAGGPDVAEGAEGGGGEVGRGDGGDEHGGDDGDFGDLEVRDCGGEGGGREAREKVGWDAFAEGGEVDDGGGEGVEEGEGDEAGDGVGFPGGGGLDEGGDVDTVRVGHHGQFWEAGRAAGGVEDRRGGGGFMRGKGYPGALAVLEELGP